MRRAARVELRSCRGCRLEIQDDLGEGWCVLIHPPLGVREPVGMLRNPAPDGLRRLVQAAEDHVSHRLEGRVLAGCRP